MSERAERIYVVDRTDGASAILVADDGGDEAHVARGLLPFGVVEGSVLRVPLATDGTPSWRAAVRDEEIERARREEAAEALEELRKRDPGGDVVL